MREFKFKAFIKHLKWMCEVESIDFVNKMVEVDLSAGQGDTSWYSFEEVEFVQFTGLYDKYQKPIYEGDIVYFNDFNSLRTGGYAEDNILSGQVKFIYGGWIVDTSIGHYELHNAKENDEELEIIGNKYEHPHLLREGTI